MAEAAWVGAKREGRMSLITRHQLQLLQIARRQVERASNGVFDEQAWRIALRNAGGVKPDQTGQVSSKSLDQAGFERVMDLLESMGFREKDKPADYWRSRCSVRTGLASTRQVREIYRLADGGRYTLPSMCLRASNNTHQTPEQLTPQQAHKLIEALKAVTKREDKCPQSS